ncbi:MAG: electron transporter RnfC, partial [Oscillospiraceae bacterium]|nr:electron transporter RnfC [Oscillospiraceae bacterium]
MEDYTKFRLKSRDEIVPLLAGKDNLFVVACNKCFKEFENVEEPERSELEKIAAEQGKKVTGCMNVDFLCNKTTTQKKLELPAGTENVAVISCGLGIQTIADLSDLPVYAAADSVKSYDGHHGMALTNVHCDGCG